MNNGIKQPRCQGKIDRSEWVERKVDCHGRKQRVLITNDFYERNYNHNIMQNTPVDISILLGTEIKLYDIVHLG